MKPSLDWGALIRTPIGLFWAVSYVAFVLLAWLTPKTILDDWSQAREYADFVASLVPQIDRVTLFGGQAAQVNRFVYSLAWTYMPIPALVLTVRGFIFVMKHGCKSRLTTPFSVLVLLVAVCGFAWLTLYLPTSGASRAAGAYFRSDIVRGLWTPLGAFAPAFCVIAVALHVVCILSGRFHLAKLGPREIERRARISNDT